MELTEFLLARIAEDEAAARAATGEEWRPGAFVQDGRRLWQVCAVPRPLVARVEAEADAAHIARHDPARVLAECDAKRLLIEGQGHARTPRKDVPQPLSWEDLPGSWTRVQLASPGRVEDMPRDEFIERFTEPAPPSLTMRAVALPYADHPDYDPAWKP